MQIISELINRGKLVTDVPPGGCSRRLISAACAGCALAQGR